MWNWISMVVLKAILWTADVRVNVQNPRSCDITVLDARWVWPALAGGRSMTLGDAFVRGEWHCPDPAKLFGKFIEWPILKVLPDMHAWRFKLKSLVRNQQDKALSKRVAEEHYDLPSEFYHLMLGPDPMIYTSAMPQPGDTLAQAQERKLDRICFLADLESWMHVLDIGCGWGGTIAHAVERFHVRGLGISNSAGHVKYANDRYYRAHACEFIECDYRDITGLFDRVFSIEMIEAVGVRNLPTYFDKVAEVLKPEGLFNLQAISSPDPRHRTNEWIERYIFPGGELATIPEMVSAAAAAGLKLIHQEDFPEGYVWTLQKWRENIIQNSEEIIERFGLRVLRTFECYLAMCEAGFATGRTSVSQFVFVRA